MSDAGEINYASMTSADVEEIGFLMEGAKAEDLDDIPDSVIAESLDSFNELELDPVQSRLIIQKLKSTSGDLSSHVQTWEA